MSAVDVRLALLQAGYVPIPAKGKACHITGWATKIATNAAEIDVQARQFADHTNTGILTKSTPAVDIDVTFLPAAEAVEALAREVFEERGVILLRIGKAPKRAFLLRTDEPFDKLTAAFTAPDGSTHKIEILGAGQQVIVDGIHPGTGKPYAWHGGTPLSVPRDDLPYTRREDMVDFLAKASKLLVEEFGFQPVGGKAKANGADLHDGGQYERADWAELIGNIIAGRDLHDSATRLAASYLASGMDTTNASRAIEALFLTSDTPRDERWKARFNDIGRAVRSAKEKFANGDGGGTEAAAPQNDGLESFLAAGVDMQGLEWFWPGRLGRGKLALLVGLPDKGKGLICAFLAAAATARVDLPCGEGKAPQGNVIWFNAEDGTQDTIIPRLVAAKADLTRIHFIKSARVKGENRTFSLITDLHLLRKKILEIGNVVLIIIDPISSYMGVGKMDARSQNDVRGVLTPLRDMAEDLDVLMLGICHFNKKTDVTNALLRVADSIAFTALARQVHAVVDDPEDDKLRLFVKVKNNLAPPDQKALRYGFGVEHNVGHDAARGIDISAPYVVWSPEGVDVSANDAMQAAASGSGYASREAQDFLTERLKDGPVLANDVTEEAAQAGIAKRTLYRAKREMKIISRKRKGDDPGWTWTLPLGRCEPGEDCQPEA